MLLKSWSGVVEDSGGSWWGFWFLTMMGRGQQWTKHPMFQNIAFYTEYNQNQNLNQNTKSKPKPKPNKNLNFYWNKTGNKNKTNKKPGLIWPNQKLGFSEPISAELSLFKNHLSSCGPCAAFHFVGQYDSYLWGHVKPIRYHGSLSNLPMSPVVPGQTRPCRPY